MGSRPLPMVKEYNKPFFEDTGEELKLQKCAECGNVIYFPRVACNKCLSTMLDWETASPYGTLYTYCKVYRPQHEYFFEHVPLILIAVQMDAGPMIVSNLINYGSEDFYIGMKVKAKRLPVKGSEIKLLYFEPA